MKDKVIAAVLRRITRTRVNESDSSDYAGLEDSGATLAAQRAAIRALIDILDPGPSIEADTEAEGLTGPENSREEVVGTSTEGKSSNFSNSGFGGGSAGRRLAA